MYNNTLTLTKKYNISSSITQNEVKEENIIIFQQPNLLSLEENIFDFVYLYSIELKRNKIKKDLIEYFDFETHYAELDFLAGNKELLQILPKIGNYIKNNFDSNSNLVLDLMSENDNWQTLFINIYSQMEWEKSNKFIDTFLDSLFEFYPAIAPKLNVNIIPNEL